MKSNIKYILIIIVSVIILLIISRFGLNLALNRLFAERFTSGILSSIVNENTTRYFDGERFWLREDGKFKNKKGNILTIGGTAGYVSWNNIFSGNLFYSVLLTGDGEKGSLGGIEYEVNYYSKGLYDDNFELLSGEVIERISELGIWMYSKGILQNGKFEVTENHVCKDDNNFLYGGFEPLCFLSSRPSTGDEEKIEQRCYDITTLLNMNTIHGLFIGIGRN